MKLAPLLMSLAACGGAAPTASTTDNATAAPDEPPYAGLFQSGTRWTFEAKTVESDMDGKREFPGTFACTAGEVEPFAGGQLVEITCEERPAGGIHLPVGGWFAATAEGLWILDEKPTDASALEPKRIAMHATPRPHTEQHEEGGGDEPASGWMIEVKAGEAGAWCTTHGSWAGDDGSNTYCVAPGEGLVGGGAHFGGGMVAELTFSRAR